MKQQTLIDKLRSRIDKNGFQISEDILYSDWNHPMLKAAKKSVEAQQALDKRLLGRLIELERNLSHAYGLLGDATEENSVLQKENIRMLRDSGVIVWQD